jgi:hypothetical protein
MEFGFVLDILDNVWHAIYLFVYSKNSVALFRFGSCELLALVVAEHHFTARLAMSMHDLDYD